MIPPNASTPKAIHNHHEWGEAELVPPGVVPVNPVLMGIVGIDVVSDVTAVTIGAVVEANGVNVDWVIGNVVSTGVGVVVVMLTAAVVAVVITGIVVVGATVVVVVVVGAAATGLTPYVTA